MVRPAAAAVLRRGLRHDGEPAFLRGAPAGYVRLARNTRVDPGIGDTADDNYVLRYDVAVISAEFVPKVGDTLVHPEGTFVLDRLLIDNRVNLHFAVVPA